MRAATDDRGTGDGLMRLLQQIADDLDEVRGEKRRHVAVLERTIKRVRPIETLFRATDPARKLATLALEHLPRVPSLPRIDSGPAADVQLLPPLSPTGVDSALAIRALTRRGVPVMLAKSTIEALMADPALDWSRAGVRLGEQKRSASVGKVIRCGQGRSVVYRLLSRVESVQHRED